MDVQMCVRERYSTIYTCTLTLLISKASKMSSSINYNLARSAGRHFMSSTHMKGRNSLTERENARFCGITNVILPV